MQIHYSPAYCCSVLCTQEGEREGERGRERESKSKSNFFVAGLYTAPVCASIKAVGQEDGRERGAQRILDTGVAPRGQLAVSSLRERGVHSRKRCA